MAPWRRHGIALLTLCIALCMVGCGSDVSTVEGALSSAASAVGARDHEALFRVLDERARFSISSVFQARTLAAKVVRESYPESERATALAELGDAVRAKNDVDLFRMRCADTCLDAFAASLGAPSKLRVDGRVTIVKTVRGTEAQLYRADDGRYGLVWETAALMRERTRAAAELDLIQKNGEQYRAQRSLEGSHD